MQGIIVQLVLKIRVPLHIICRDVERVPLVKGSFVAEFLSGAGHIHHIAAVADVDLYHIRVRREQQHLLPAVYIKAVREVRLDRGEREIDDVIPKLRLLTDDRVLDHHRHLVRLRDVEIFI